MSSRNNVKKHMSESKHSHDRHALETLRLIGPDPENWVVARPGIDHNALIVGGGQTGAAFAFALRRAGIGGVSVIDAAPDEARAGSWRNYARMNRLRTPKILPGPEAGLPGLGFQAWHEARHGEASYADIERIGRKQWADYLAWYREFLGIPVRYGTTLTLIEPQGAHFRLHLTVRTARGVELRVETARKIILANGVWGNGRPNIVPPLASLPATHLAHTSDAIDFASLAGKTVAVIGGAASAFDAAATALEAGARDVHLFVRRAALPAVPVSRARAYPGAYDNFPSLPDAVRWRQALRFRRAGSTAPADAIERVARQANFHLHLAAPWHEAVVDGDRVRARAEDGTFEFDRDRGHGLHRRSACTPRTRGHRRSCAALARPLHARVRRTRRCARCTSLPRRCARICRKAARRGIVPEAYPRLQSGGIREPGRAGRRRAVHEARYSGSRSAHQPGPVSGGSGGARSPHGRRCSG